MLKSIESQQLQQFQDRVQKLRQDRAAETPVTRERTPSVAEGDRVSLGQAEAAAPTYEPTSAGAVANSVYEQIRSMLVRLLEEQGVAAKVANGADGIDIASLSPEEATQLVAEDGYFGVEQTSQRIVDTAIAIAGGDPLRMEAIRRGIEDGFGAAEKAWGGTLPEISYQTKEAVFSKLETWYAEATGEG
jgi:hypothetical protein